MSRIPFDRLVPTPLAESRAGLAASLVLFLGVGALVGVTAAGVTVGQDGPTDAAVGHLGPNEPMDVELGVEYDEAVVRDNESIEMSVVEADSGEPVTNVSVIVRDRTVEIEEPYYETTGPASSNVSIDVDPDQNAGDITPDWRTSQDTGTLGVEIIPPADSAYVDDQQNAKVTIVRSDQ